MRCRGNVAPGLSSGCPLFSKGSMGSTNWSEGNMDSQVRCRRFVSKWIARGLVLMACGLMPTAPARAQFAVIDVASLTQLISQAQTLLQQLNAAQTQVAQAQTLFQSMTGPRGMQQLLNVANLNYLPTSAAELSAVEQGNAGLYPNLAAAISNAEMSNAVLSPAQLSSLSPDEQSSIGKARMAVAALQGIADQALADSSQRFTDIQELMQ